jgi:hypothetical protein
MSERIYRIFPIFQPFDIQLPLKGTLAFQVYLNDILRTCDGKFMILLNRRIAYFIKRKIKFLRSGRNKKPVRRQFCISPVKLLKTLLLIEFINLTTAFLK